MWACWKTETEETPAPRGFVLLMHGHPGRSQASAACRTSARATKLETENTGRKRRLRGFHYDGFEHGRRRWAPAAWQPWPRLMSLLVAGRGRGAGWGRTRVLWRCSAAAYLGAGLPTGGDRQEASFFVEEQSEECWWSWVAWRELIVAMEGNSTLPFIGRRSGSSSRLQPPTINGGDCGWAARRRRRAARCC